MQIDFLSAEEIYGSFRPTQAVEALRSIVQAGFRPGGDPVRSSLAVDHGSFLMMPAASSELGFGIKLLSLTEAGYRPDLPRIKGIYVLFDPETLAPAQLLDGQAVTNLRTPAVSVATIVDFLEGPGNASSTANEPLRVVIFGTGPQGQHHEATLRDCLHGRELEVTFVSRSQPEENHVAEHWAKAESVKAQKAIAAAELIITATSSPEPLVTLGDVRADAIIVALGSHTPDARELSGELVGASTVIVEDLDATFVEGGDVIQAEAEGFIERKDVVSMAEVIRGDVEITRERPIVFKFTGMAWEDLAIARAIASAAQGS